MTPKDIELLFYGYGIIYIVYQLFSLFKKSEFPEFDFKIDASNPLDGLNHMKNKLDKIDMNYREKVFILINSIWVLMGLWTPEKNLFIAVMIVGVSLPIYATTTFLLKKNIDLAKKSTTAGTIFQILCVVLIIINHLLNNLI